MDFKDIQLGCQCNDNLDTTSGTIKVASFNERPLETLEMSSPTKQFSERPSPLAEETKLSINWNIAASDPKHVLEKILEVGSPGMKLGQSIDDLVQDLSSLHSRTRDKLGSMSGDAQVKITLQGQITRTDRARIHQWVRLAFCLLRTELVQAVSEDAPEDKTVILACPDDRFFELESYLHDSRVDIPRLYEFFRRGRESEDSKHDHYRRGDWKSTKLHLVLPLRPNLQRSERRPVHQILEKKSGRQFQTETITEHRIDSSVTTAAIAVYWSSGRKRRRQDRSQTLHTLLVLRKRNVEHVVAMHTLARALRCRFSDIQIAGIKDRVAITTQFISLNPFVSVPRIMQAQTFLRSKGLDLCGPIMAVKEGLHRGQARGNRFSITLRNIYQTSVQVNPKGETQEERMVCPRSKLNESVERVRQYGFINFFGEQRIGSLQACVGSRTVDIGRAMLQHDWDKVVNIIMRIGTDANSVKVSQTWQTSGGDLEATWKALSKSQGSQSRQRMLLQSLRRYGVDDASIALKSLPYSDRSFWVSAYSSFVWNRAATARIRLYGAEKVQVGDLVLSDQVKSTGGPMLVTSKEMACQYSIHNVVLPLPGYLVQYPSNQVGQIYRDTLKSDRIEYVKDAPLDVAAKGTYRPLIASASSLSSGWVEGEDGAAYRLAFDLPTGSYATVLLRELLRTTASREADEGHRDFLSH